MSFSYLQKIPTPTQIIQQMTMSAKLIKLKAARDKDILNVLKGATFLLQSKRIKYIQFEINDEDGFDRSLKDIGAFLNQYQYIIRNDNLDAIKDFTRPYKYDVQDYLAELVV